MSGKSLKAIRVALAVIFWTGITLLLLDFTGALHGWLGWKNGRTYCNTVCPV